MKGSYSVYILKSQYKQLSGELKVAVRLENQTIDGAKQFWKKMIRQLTPMVADLEQSITKLTS